MPGEEERPHSHVMTGLDTRLCKCKARPEVGPSPGPQHPRSAEPDVPLLSPVLEVLLDPCRTWCPASTCQAVCQLQEMGLQTPQLVQCKACHTEFCSACKASWHPGQGCPETMPITFLPGETRYPPRTARVGWGLGEGTGGGVLP